MDTLNYIKTLNNSLPELPYRNVNIRYKSREDICYEYNWQTISIPNAIRKTNDPMKKMGERREQVFHRRGNTHAQLTCEQVSAPAR